jgi:hypothetical protein
MYSEIEMYARFRMSLPGERAYIDPAPGAIGAAQP